MKSDTSSAPVDTVIFDLGAVLIDWSPRYLYRKIFDDESEMDHFLEHICTPEWNAEQDAGRSWADAVELLIDRHPQYSEQIRAYWKRWPEMLNGPIPGTVEILHEVHAAGRYRLLALTNWSAETWHHAWDQYDFLRVFEGILVSGVEKVKKPDPRIYALMTERYRLEPGHCLFIDDSRANVAGARDFGWQAIHYSSPGQLRRDLQRTEII